MKHVINILKGICIGVSNIIPGFSGGTMAVLLHVYDLFVYSLGNIFNDFLNVVKKAWSLFVGIALGLLLGMFAVVKLLEVAPFITIMFFVGLILGSIPEIFVKAKAGKLHFYDVIAFLIAVAVIVVMPLVNPSAASSIEYTPIVYLIMFALGIVCSAAMVIPGVSGSLLLMIFGYYAFLMSTLKGFLSNLINFSADNYWGMFLTILCFGIGCIIGLVFVSKLITKLLKVCPKTVFITILGLLLASPFSIIYSTNSKYAITYDVLTIVLAAIACIAGIALVLISGKISQKYAKKEEGEVEDRHGLLTGGLEKDRKSR